MPDPDWLHATAHTAKHIAVRLMGREKANRVSRPYHDWRARRSTRDHLGSLPDHGLRINLGCGYHPLVGWVNIDGARVVGADIVHDLRRTLPFPNGSAEAIFAEHVIEHLSREEGQSLLAECHRVLAPGGVLRLSTPDLELFLRSYAGDRRFLDSLPPRPGFVSASDAVNRAMRHHGHLWSYDEELLRHFLAGSGFTSITRQSCGISAHPAMAGIDLEERAYESLYVEAVRD